MQTIKVVRRSVTSKLPEKKTAYAHGFDVYADESYDLHPHGVGIVDTGLNLEVPDGFTLMMNVRSGLSTKGVMLANGTGIIDSDYRGPLKVILYNGNTSHIEINSGERIAQCYLVHNIITEFKEVLTLNETVRGVGGLGSTGKD